MPTSGIAENASSLPSSTKASGPFGALVSFPYFPYTRLITSKVPTFVPNGYQQATLGGNVDLRAQVSGAIWRDFFVEHD